jgi:EAL domain-containing protein (putative c-di-GMP-specific phosphodiesterase class I)
MADSRIHRRDLLKGFGTLSFSGVVAGLSGLARSVQVAPTPASEHAIEGVELGSMQLENDLRRALERQEFQIHYQPIVSLLTGTITGFEAFLRWQHPHRGLISPMEFIYTAEETGLIIPIGYWLLREACLQIYLLQKRSRVASPLTVSVNFSAQQFSQPDLIQQIDQILHETGLDAHRLKLEITESVLLEHAESAYPVLLELASLGVQLDIDNFGIGYSSLSELYSLPIHSLKIDRSLISNRGDNLYTSEIVPAIVTLAHQLRMNVVALGVETVEQLKILRALHCEHGQGYFFSRPLDSVTAGALIAMSPQW